MNKYFNDRQITLKTKKKALCIATQIYSLSLSPSLQIIRASLSFHQYFYSNEYKIIL